MRSFAPDIVATLTRLAVGSVTDYCWQVRAIYRVDWLGSSPTCASQRASLFHAPPTPSRQHYESMVRIRQPSRTCCVSWACGGGVARGGGGSTCCPLAVRLPAAQRTPASLLLTHPLCAPLPQPTFPLTEYAPYAATSIAHYAANAAQVAPIPYVPNLSVAWDPSPRTIVTDAWDGWGYPSTPVLQPTPDELQAAAAAAAYVGDFCDPAWCMLTVCACEDG